MDGVEKRTFYICQFATRAVTCEPALKVLRGGEEHIMKRLMVCAALAIAVAMPGAASAFGHGGGGGHGFGGGHFDGGFYRGGWGYRGWGYGGYYPAYYGAYGCWRWVAWPYWHRVWACY
jgi:hypothetical protein